MVIRVRGRQGRYGESRNTGGGPPPSRYLGPRRSVAGGPPPWTPTDPTPNRQSDQQQVRILMMLYRRWDGMSSMGRSRRAFDSARKAFDSVPSEAVGGICLGSVARVSQAHTVSGRTWVTQRPSMARSRHSPLPRPRADHPHMGGRRRRRTRSRRRAERRHCARSPRTAPVTHCGAVSRDGLIVAHRIDAVRAAVVRGLAARQA